MRYNLHHILFLFSFIFLSCNQNLPEDNKKVIKEENAQIVVPETADSIPGIGTSIIVADTQKIKPADIVDFAKTLIGIPYKYASADPAQGFDCSGFITYVFKHFNIAVPRSSVDFTNAGKDVMIEHAKAGDLILFTGTDSTVRIAGHMGIVTENIDSLRFIHSTSGRQYGVVITPLAVYYQRRFLKVIRIF